MVDDLGDMNRYRWRSDTDEVRGFVPQKKEQKVVTFSAEIVTRGKLVFVTENQGI
jgi:hypothetical protein